MSKFNKLSRAEMKNVLGGKLPPGDPGNPPCLGKHVVCGEVSYPDVCCKTIEDAGRFCPVGTSPYGCVGGVEEA